MSTLKKLSCLGIVAAALSIGPLAGVTSAQTAPPTIADFIDEQGNFDQAGYLAALAGSQGSGGTAAQPLARTGADIDQMVGVGAAVIVLGAGAVVGARRRVAS